jgi:hypothetical protein
MEQEIQSYLLLNDKLTTHDDDGLVVIVFQSHPPADLADLHSFNKIPSIASALRSIIQKRSGTPA